MLLFQKSLVKNTVSPILIICIIATIAGSVLLYPQEAEALCPVSIVTDSDSVPETGWEALQNFFRGENVAISLEKLLISIWEKTWTILEWLLGVFLNLLLHQILAQLTNDIVNWIQNGTEPRFLTMGLDDWLGMGVDNALGAFIDQYLGIGWLCEPFDIDIKIAMLAQTTFKEEAECTLSDMVENIEDFYNDFSKGGWKGWIELTEGGNNVYSAYLIALDEKNRIIGIENKEQEAEIARGDGFFSPKDCIWYDANGRPIDLQVDSNTGRRYTSGYKDVWGTPSLPAKCQPSTDPNAEPFDTVGGIPGPCYKKCISHTPGQTISDTVSDTIGGYRDTLNAQIGAASAKAGPYSVYVQAILTALINRTFKEGYGLLFAQDEDVPTSENPVPPLPVNPGDNEENKVMASLLKTALTSIKETLECAGANCLLDQQKQNLAVLKLILSKYEEIDSILDQILDPNNACSSSSVISWASNEKTNVTYKITNIKKEISDLQVAIAKTQSWISQISAIILSIDVYSEKFAIWEATYKASDGIYDPNDPNDPVVLAQKNLDNAEDKVIAQTQALLTEINGSSTGTTFAALKAEASIAYMQVVNLALALSIKRGVPSYPATGTLYARLEEAKNIKEAADSYLSACLFAP